MGISADEEPVIGDQSNDQQDVLSASECDETDISCQTAMAGFQFFQEKFFGIHLEYKNVKSKYEGKCARYKELEATNQTLNEDISTLREVCICVTERKSFYCCDSLNLMAWSVLFYLQLTITIIMHALQ